MASCSTKTHFKQWKKSEKPSWKETRSKNIPTHQTSWDLPVSPSQFSHQTAPRKNAHRPHLAWPPSPCQKTSRDPMVFFGPLYFQLSNFFRFKTMAMARWWKMTTDALAWTWASEVLVARHEVCTRSRSSSLGAPKSHQSRSVWWGAMVKFCQRSRNIWKFRNVYLDR